MNETPNKFDLDEFSEKITNEMSMLYFEVIVGFNGVMIEIQYKYKINDGKSCDYFVKYKSWYIDDEFMR